MENQNSSWLKLTGHARQCVLEDMPELKRYQSEEGNVVLFFNCVHDLIGAEFVRTDRSTRSRSNGKLTFLWTKPVTFAVIHGTAVRVGDAVTPTPEAMARR